jgi:hypothetical protein
MKMEHVPSMEMRMALEKGFAKTIHTVGIYFPDSL